MPRLLHRLLGPLRVCQPARRGRLLQVDAGPNHLRELREIIYPTLKPQRTTEPLVPEGFTPLPGETVTFMLELNGTEQIADLLAMTPHLYRASAEGRAKSAMLAQISLAVEVRLTRFERVTCG